MIKNHPIGIGYKKQFIFPEFHTLNNYPSSTMLFSLHNLFYDFLYEGILFTFFLFVFFSFLIVFLSSPSPSLPHLPILKLFLPGQIKMASPQNTKLEGYQR